MKTFLLGVVKLAVALTLGLIVLGVGAWAISAFSEHREAVKNAPLETPKVWRQQTVGALNNAQLSLATKWHDGHMSYQFEMKGYPSSLSEKRANTRAYELHQPRFTLIFLDESGFKLFDHQIPFSEMTRVVDDSGKPAGLSAKGRTYESADTYRKAVTWEVTWSSD